MHRVAQSRNLSGQHKQLSAEGIGKGLGRDWERFLVIKVIINVIIYLQAGFSPRVLFSGILSYF
jgi:hypothetical protein